MHTGTSNYRKVLGNTIWIWYSGMVINEMILSIFKSAKEFFHKFNNRVEIIFW